jgi:hypothetical protein
MTVLWCERAEAACKTLKMAEQTSSSAAILWISPSKRAKATTGISAGGRDIVIPLQPFQGLLRNLTYAHCRYGSALKWVFVLLRTYALAAVLRRVGYELLEQAASALPTHRDLLFLLFHLLNRTGC